MNRTALITFVALLMVSMAVAAQTSSAPKWLTPPPTVTLYGTQRTPYRADAGAIYLDLFTSDGQVWPVVCRRPNLGPCFNALAGPLPVAFQVRGDLVQRNGRIEIAPSQVIRLFPGPTW